MEICFKSIDEFLEWNIKRDIHMKEIEQQNYELEMENRRLKAELQQKREKISELTGPVDYPIDDLPDDIFG